MESEKKNPAWFHPIDSLRSSSLGEVSRWSIGVKAFKQREQHVQRLRGRRGLGTPRELGAWDGAGGSWWALTLGMESGTRWCKKRLSWDFIWHGVWESLWRILSKRGKWFDLHFRKVPLAGSGMDAHVGIHVCIFYCVSAWPCVCHLCLVFWGGNDCEWLWMWAARATAGRRPDSGRHGLLLQVPRQLRINEWLLPGSPLGPLKKPCPSKGTSSQEFSLFCSTNITGGPQCLHRYPLGCPLPHARLGVGDFLWLQSQDLKSGAASDNVQRERPLLTERVNIFTP